MSFSNIPLHDSALRTWLTPPKNIAVVGLSPKPERPSNQVASYLIAQGFSIIPVNPGQDKIVGLPCFSDIASIPDHIDIACIFRRPDQVLPIVRQAVAKGVSLVWMQAGIVNMEAAAFAHDHNIAVVMDRCMKIEHQRLFF